ncbi:MAG: alanine dehydrogenase [Abitibacteriaceae bacterium]|nr:alanine dehydrogenase [Abditibacteriaceae bacterium]
MKIGIPREIKANENRVSLRPAGAEVLVQDGHEVLIEKDAGVGSGFSDHQYEQAGARILDEAKAVWEAADLILKVKEPLPSEYPFLRPGQTVFTYFHFAASQELTQAVIDSGTVAIAYETVQEPDRSLPLLLPMSEVAGRMAVQEGAKYLEKYFGGRGLLLSGVPGTPRADILIIGGGIVGINAAKIAAGFGANVTILDVNLDRLRYLDDVMPANVSTLYSDPHTIRDGIRRADVVIGAVLLPGKKAPRLIKRDDLKTMQEGAVIVDVAIDQGGCVETSHPTTHENPTFVVDGVIHYCVANMPGAVPRTSTIALTNATFPYVRRLANRGWRDAANKDAALKSGLNIVEGKVTYAGVSEAFGLEYTSPESVLQ